MSRQNFQRTEVATEIGLPCAVLDKDRFMQSTMGDANLQLEILDLFEQQLLNLHHRLKNETISTQDRKYCAHTLRGAASAIGALEIENLAATWEKVGFDQMLFERLLEHAQSAFFTEVRPFRA